MNKNRNTGFTLIELLATLGIVAVLIALLLPALSKVKTLAQDVRQKGQINAVEIAIEVYQNDFGMYPSSGYYPADNTPRDTDGVPYYGSEKLAEALLGRDLLGVHKDVPVNFYKFDGVDSFGNPRLCNYAPVTPSNLNERKGPYLEADKMNPVESDSDQDIFNLLPGGHYIADEYKRDSLKVGLPLLYYKAKPDNKIQQDSAGALSQDSKVYDYRDSNMPFDNSVAGDAEALYIQGRTNIWDTTEATTAEDYFDGFVTNTNISPETGIYTIPYRAQSYLLISAGLDGIYGTSDDICNFEHE